MAYGSAMISRPIPLLAALLLASGAAFAAPAKPPAPEPPITVETLLAQAHAASAKGDTELALRLAQSAIVADPARPGSYVALGDIYAETGQPEYARNYYDAALGIDPTEPGALKALTELDRTHPGDTARANQ
ncbi:MAG TPA: tetratricopeptide repeat protein [Rhizomicrobium sp.]|nr:tetratricopeptide repeat protein [Rhizomicrobium sp.]